MGAEMRTDERDRDGTIERDVNRNRLGEIGRQRWKLGRLRDKIQKCRDPGGERNGGKPQDTGSDSGPPAGPCPLQPTQPRRFGVTVLRAAGFGATAHRLLRGSQAQGGAVVQHDCALLQVQLRPRPRPAPPGRPGPAPPRPQRPGLYLRTPAPLSPPGGPLKVTEDWWSPCHWAPD